MTGPILFFIKEEARSVVSPNVCVCELSLHGRRLFVGLLCYLGRYFLGAVFYIRTNFTADHACNITLLRERGKEK